MKEMLHINDVWNYLDQFNTVAELEEAFGNIPTKFGYFEITNMSTYKEDGDVEICNSYWNDDVSGYEYDYHTIEVQVEDTDREVRYEVWALGYDKDGWCTDIEEFIDEFDTADEAIAFAKTIQSGDDVFEEDCGVEFVAGDYLEIRVETIKEDDETNLNIETVFSSIVPIHKEN